MPAAGVRAESIAVAPMGSDPADRRMVASADRVLREVSGLEVLAAPPASRARPPSPCEAASCWLARARDAGVDLQLFVGFNGAIASVLLADVTAGTVSKSRSADLAGQEAEVALRPLIEGVLPAFARRGWGGLAVTPSGPAKVKVDGRAVALSKDKPLAVTASVHSVDVLFDSGAAVLQRLHVPEGGRLTLAVAPVTEVEARPGTIPSAYDERLRMVSFGLWTAGALGIAGSLLAGAASRTEGAHLATCQGADRSCETQVNAGTHREQALAYARTGNVLLGGGTVLLLSGAGLFTFDLWRTRGQK